MGWYQRRVHGESQSNETPVMKTPLLVGAFLALAAAAPEPEPKADADPWYGYGYRGYGWGGYYRPYGYYGKRSADAEPEPTAAADPNADADAWYGHYGYGYRGWDTEATTGLMATMATTERGLQMPSLSPQLRLSPMLMLIRGTAMATVDMDGAATTGPMDMGVTGEVTGAKQTNREVDSSSDCDFCRHYPVFPEPAPSMGCRSLSSRVKGPNK